MFALGLIILIVLLALIGQCSGESKTATSSPKSRSAAVSSREKTPTDPIQKEPVSQWQYSHHKDEMADGVTHNATVVSTNSVEFQFPYGGPQHANLTLRSHPRHGKDVILRIERGQFLCRSYEDCRVLIRFDEKEAVHYLGRGPSDNSTEVIFIRNYSAFVSEMQNAKKVRVAAEVYQHGAPVFEFDVSGFNVESYKQTKKP